MRRRTFLRELLSPEDELPGFSGVFQAIHLEVRIDHRLVRGLDIEDFYFMHRFLVQALSAAHGYRSRGLWV